MTQLLLIRESIKNFIGRFENYVKPISKFLLCFVTMQFINKNIGFATRLGNVAITLIVSLLASFLPLDFILFISAGFVLLHLYSLSLAAVIVVGVLFLLIFLLFFRFSPKDTLLLLFTPLCFALKIPYVIPLAAGLVSTPAAVISVGSGVIIYYIIDFVANNADNLKIADNAEILIKFKFILDELLVNNKEMIVLAIAFSITVLVVGIIRRLSVDHSWTMAIIAGTLMNILVVLIGDLKYATYISIPNLFVGSIVGILVVTVIKFFLFNVDYSRTEKVQFEDDEYIYYVKAVPKNNLPARLNDSEKNTKSATNRNKTSNRSSSREDADGYDVRKNHMSDIERAAAAKARRARQERDRK